MSTEIMKGLEKIEAATTKMLNLVDENTSRIEALEAQADRPRVAAADKAFSAEQRQYKGVFIDWLRRPHDEVTKARLTQAVGDLSTKDVSIGTGSAGGYALPEEVSRSIEHRVRQLNPFRSLVRVEGCSTNDFKALVSMGDGTAGWSVELGSRSGSAAPTLRERAPTFGEVYAYPQASNWSLEDLMFDVQAWLVNDVSAEFASLEATTIIEGNGSGKPTGILTTTPVTTADDASPSRAANVIQYVGLTNPGSPQTLNLDSLIHLVGQVKERYLVESDAVAFVMHRTTLAALRRQKSEYGGYLWGDAASGNPNTLLGYRVATCDAMPVVANDAFPILFGNWRRGYLLADRTGMTITVDPYTSPGNTKFYVRRRVGGCVLNNDAVKALRVSD